MEIRHQAENGLLTIKLEGDADHHGAMGALAAVYELTERELMPRIRLDLSGVSFMDSSGIALVMGAYKAARNIGSDFEVWNTGPQPMKVLHAAGADRIITFRQEKDTYEK